MFGTGIAHCTVDVVRVRELMSNAVVENGAGVTEASSKMLTVTGLALWGRICETQPKRVSDQPCRRRGQMRSLP